jgi:hypothetical protein
MKRFHDSTFARKIRCLLVFIVAPSLLASSLFADETSSVKSKLRRYEQGPLAIHEFRGKPDRLSTGNALTMTRVMFTFQFQIEQLANDQFKAELSSFTAFTVFLPEESWWDDARAHRGLLDHEQGHFDVAETAARRVNVAILRMFKSGKTISGVGATHAMAERALIKKMETLIKVADEQGAEENKAYDCRTRHGLWRNVQAEQRRIQTLTLVRLETELAKTTAKD